MYTGKSFLRFLTVIIVFLFMLQSIACNKERVVPSTGSDSDINDTDSGNSSLESTYSQDSNLSKDSDIFTSESSKIESSSKNSDDSPSSKSNEYSSSIQGGSSMISASLSSDVSENSSRSSQSGEIVYKTYFVSQKTGNDSNPGTENKPFKTLDKATGSLREGDTLFVMNGTYLETLMPPSGEKGKAIKIQNYPGHEPIISGAAELNLKWELHKGNIYKTPYTGYKFNQLFADGKMMVTARWPNANPNPDMVFDMQRANITGGSASGIVDSNLPAGDWSGGKIYIWPGAEWISFVREIEDYVPGNQLTVSKNFITSDPYGENNPYSPRPGNPYFLFGKLAGLDAPNEWVIENNTLYFYTPDGRSPEEYKIEYRTRDYGIDLSYCSYVEVKGIKVFACAISMMDSKYCVIDGCDQKYHEHFEDTDGYSATSSHKLNYVSGSNNVWKNSRISHASGDGIRLDGEDNLIENMLIHDINYSGGWFAGVMGQPGQNSGGVEDRYNTNPDIISTCNNVTVTRSTIFNVGRNAILHHKTGRFDITYNDLSHASKLVKDCGLTSTFGTDGKGSTIAFNWLHDNIGTYTAGVYLDCFNKNYNIHNNVIWNISWSGIQLNSYSRNNYVYNNTIINCQNSFMIYAYPGDPVDQKGSKIFNNFYDTNPTFASGSLAPWLSNNVQASTNGRLDSRFFPVQISPLIDSGVFVSGIDILYSGSAPDIGAYQYGMKRWIPGSTLKPVS